MPHDPVVLGQNTATCEKDDTDSQSVGTLYRAHIFATTAIYRWLKMLVGFWSGRGARGALLAGLLVLTGCATAPTTRTPTPTVTQVPTSTAAPTVALPVPPPPLTSFLSPPPQNCPASPPLQTLGGTGGDQGGEPPVFTNAVLVAPVWHVEQGQTTPNPYPGTKFLWEVGPNFTQPVHLEVTNLGTGEGGWWSENGTPETTYLILDPSGTGPTYAEYHLSPGPGYMVPGWREYGSYLNILQAGCYALQVTWPGGSWRMVFAAGR